MYLTLQEINQAKVRIIKYYQRNQFSDEISKLQVGESINKGSKLLNFNP